ncbi:hypothetical protein AOT83_15895 [Mycobacteroides sp. H001]|nr:hypothetical protein AOT86_14030 [Mycobacteroides sp. H072]KRQ37729.1 hypothetical protein AOT84_11700 [Mycobacteroides sp. H002]KRQ47115.1 hypothetical protein AOT85_22595 [Mycobacteroides sp. H054]KRQ69238.1 hypothetical protein AOT83_15895 [Mycobacteroides sp. H001]OHU37820.1 hypothetical protein BKG79_13090 [Mycobacteroides chelonae]
MELVDDLGLVPATRRERERRRIGVGIEPYNLVRGKQSLDDHAVVEIDDGEDVAISTVLLVL